MKQFLLSVFFVSFSLGLWAQIVTLNPNPVTASEAIDPDDPGFEIIGYATVTNVSDQAIAIKWNRVIVDMPGGWFSQICDNVLCYAPDVDSNVNPPGEGPNAPVNLAPGESTNLDVHVRPNGIDGIGQFQVEVSLVDQPDDILVTGEYTISTETTSIQEVRVNGIQLFPNPAAQFFTLNHAAGVGVARLSLFNAVGQQMKHWVVEPGRQYSLAGLPRGLYLVALQNERGKVLRTLRLVKK